MSVLPDHEIEVACQAYYCADGRALIEPFRTEQLQPASYDVLLGDEILVPTARFESLLPSIGLFDKSPNPSEIIDLSRPIPDDLYQRVDITAEGYILHPWACCLGSTVEKVCIPDHLVGRIEGKSSLGRLFVTAHITAGYLDPGFRGNVTLEIVNMLPRPVRIWPGMKIAQLGFSLLHSPCDLPYGSPDLGSHYQDAEGVEPTRYGEVQ